MRRGPLRFAVVGHGWRANFYFRLADLLPSRFQCVGAMTRGAAAGKMLEATWDIPTYRSVDQLLVHTVPEVVVTCLPRSANASVLTQLVGHDVPTLSETPPAHDIHQLRQLWTDVGFQNRVQVAEQHPYLPQISAIRHLLSSGTLGAPTSAAVSWTHDYHAIAILRSVLGVGSVPVRVHAVANTGPLLSGPDRGGWLESVQKPTEHICSAIDFGGVTGTYDFTEGQWFSPLRPRALTVRGSLGAVSDGAVVRSIGGTDTVQSTIKRRNLGEDGNLQGFDLDTLSHEGMIVYRNPYRGARLSDEEIAIATCLEATGRWTRGHGPAPYPLADACEDHAIGLAIHRAARTGRPVSIAAEPWASALAGPASPAVCDPDPEASPDVI